MNVLAAPNRYVVAAILVASVAAIWLGELKGPARATDENMVMGTVERVIEERPSEGEFARSSVEQSLLMRLDSDEEVRVENDLVPLSEGARAWLIVSDEGGDKKSYYVVQPQRTRGLIMLALLFAGVVVLVAGKQGVRALVGLVASLAVVLTYLMPRILDGANPIMAGLTAAIFILILSLYLTHGLNRKSLAAIAGISCALVCVALLAQFSVHGLALTGYGTEESLYLNVESDVPLNLIGLLVAGIIIAAIGVLDDVSVTQSATVWELARTDTTLRGWKLFRRAMAVGKDHIAAVTNTLILAYVGASLPLVLLLYLVRFPVTFILSGDVLAEQIVLTLVSSIGLVLAVPLTTAIAVVWVRTER